ncbi:Copper amine oxidase N-terminal domain-containing protein [Desulfotomaculum arcticum]|uniref:Copper amine oxidase N-terminal domain-containing protein n=1 Tax=Desulfotruncus arcticus DSM 17038 TaxID=1121424 RepID=A0A1I2WZ47_9FIRM|nr:copper amine oxidase N-terminal domain-containing protein [Desulfotruncus arcticus]SFH06570.1 Copper amine oxidase N-terminal domain-containing protein [Desulfotomaculum arcticum] [Desulfotruncus arcticus DSM 17038]
MKVRNKKICLAVALIFLLNIIAPLGAFASDVEVLDIPVVDDDKVQKLGTVFSTESPGKVQPDDSAILRLPEDFKYMNTDDVDADINDTANVMSEDDWNTLTVDGVELGVVGAVYAGQVDYHGTQIPVAMIPVDKSVKLGNKDTNYFEWPVKVSGEKNSVFSLWPDGHYHLNTGITVEKLGDNEIKIETHDLTPAGTPLNDGLDGPDPGCSTYMYVHNGAIYVDEGFDGTILATIDAPSGSSIASGEVPIGRVSGGEVDIEVMDAPNFGDDTSTDDPVVIRFKEDRAGALADGEDESIKLVLPDGFEWANVSAKAVESPLSEAEGYVADAEDLIGDVVDNSIFTNIKKAADEAAFNTAKSNALTEINNEYTAAGGLGTLSGDRAKTALEDAYDAVDDIDYSDIKATPTTYGVESIWGDNPFENGAELYVDGDELIIDTNSFAGTSEESCFEIRVGIKVEDETDAKTGDVIAKVDGETTCPQSEIVVGHYGNYDVKMETGDVPTIYAGQLEQIIADIKVNESVAGSMVDGRSLLLTLPNGAKWGQDADMDSDDDNKASLEYVGLVGDDGRTAKWSVNGVSTNDAGELTLGDIEVMVEPGFEGDLVAEVGGTLAVDADEITLAKVVPAVKVAAEKVDGLIIGRDAQDVGDITITEADAGLIKAGEDLVIDLPRGVQFAGEPEVKVTEGDLEIDDVSVKDDDSDEDNLLVIGINDDSIEAGTIVISGIQYSLDRTVAEGDIKVSVKGSAINEVNDADAVKDEIPTDEWDARDIDEDGDDEGLVFPQQEDAAVIVNAYVGTPAPAEQKLTTTITLGDNGSYISDGRIMVQLRDAATALGVEPQNIFWDNATKSATFVKGERVVQITVGDPQVKLNGTALPTDKGAEIKDGRTFVSLSAAGVALNAVTAWDNDTKTAALTVK